MYDETGPDGKRRYTVAQIAAESAVTRPTTYRHLKLPGINGWMTRTLCRPIGLPR
jgi:hypothetical protein